MKADILVKPVYVPVQIILETKEELELLLLLYTKFDQKVETKLSAYGNDRYKSYVNCQDKMYSVLDNLRTKYNL